MRQFGVAGLILVLFATTSVAQEPLNEQQAAAKIELFRAVVERDDSLPDRPVVSINLRGIERFNNKYLHVLKSFPNLASLDLSSTRITNPGLKELRGLSKLTSLSLASTHTRDTGLRELVDSKDLRTLDLHETPVSDAGVRTIVSFVNLETLRLSQTRITDAGLAEIGKCKNLTARP